MFSVSACSKCGKGSFKLVEVEPTGSRVKMFFVQCTACNTPVGVTEYYTHGTTLERLEKIEAQVASLSSDLDSLRVQLHEVIRLLRSR